MPPVSRSQIPYFGQAWTLRVGYADAASTSPDGLTYKDISTNIWEPEALHITFEVLQSTFPEPWWYADIVIYNLDVTEIQNAVYNARKVILSAGFQTGPTSSKVIWSGPVFQVVYERENVVDQKITLHCAANPYVMNNVIAFSMGVYSTQADLLVKAAGAINLQPLASSGTTATLSPYAAKVLKETQYPRGNTVFGKTSRYLSQLADDHFMATYRDSTSAYMTEISDGKSVPDPDYVFCPPQPPDQVWNVPAGTTPTIIGTPHQFPQGVIFTVLLDPRLQVKVPIQVVQLACVLPSQLTVNPDPSSDFTAPFNTLRFFVGQVKHVGDSRGNDWYTEVTGYATTYAADLLNGGFGVSSGQ
jgi:hypothetical protein